MTDTLLPSATHGRATPRLGIAYIPTMTPESLLDLARIADDSGLDDLWVWEDAFKQSGIAAATAALAVTGRIRVAIGLMPVPLRNVGLSAMEIALVDRLFPGRFVPAIGHGVQEWMGQAGVRVATPLALLREYHDALRRLLIGESITTDGPLVHLDDVQLGWPPLREVPLMVGGTGPRTLDFAGSLKFGTILPNAWTDAELSAAVDRISAAHVAGPNADSTHEIVYTLIAATGEGARERVDVETAKWRDNPADGVGAAGDAATIARAITRLARIGATSIVIQPTEDEPDLPAFISFLGREVRPLLSSP